MAKLIWSERAATDLEDIYEYIAHDSLIYARYQVERILNAIERLAVFPESGRSLPEFPYCPIAISLSDSTVSFIGMNRVGKRCIL
jgi:plasmid stabilization system protein ParE